MNRTGRIISRYLVLTVLPYFAASWLLLSAILFLQQAGRFREIFFNTNLPAGMVWQLTIALVPNVVSFTCPMAMIVGTVIGLAKLQNDNELVALRAAGVGNIQIMLPMAVLGIVLSAFSFLVNLEGVPIAAGLVRRIALETAIKKLESPVEPGSFDSELAGLTIFVQNGDVDTGRWKDIFIVKEEPSLGIMRLITADEGRIDFTGEDSELVLDNAVVTTLPKQTGGAGYASENLGQVRFAIKTRRGEMLQKLSRGNSSIEELGLTQLADYAATSEGRDQTEAQILWYRRILLSITPLIFSLLGTAMVLRFSRSGRGMGILLALMALIGYYLLAFGGEQLTRTGYTSALAGSLLPVVGSAVAIAWFSFKSRAGDHRGIGSAWAATLIDKFRGAPDKLQFSNLFVDVTTGIRDLDIAVELVKYFLLATCFLGSVFLIFTAFDLWKYAGRMEGGTGALLSYLWYLSPVLFIQLAPAAAMIAILATYMIKSRRNEIVTWIAAGQSAYRMLLPCFLLSVVLGIICWQMQERILPEAARRQDELRSLIVGRGAPDVNAGRQWVTGSDRLYSFQPAKKDLAAASDNEKQIHSDPVSDLLIFEFDKRRALQTVYRAKAASWKNDKVVLDQVEQNDVGEGAFQIRKLDERELPEPADPFARSRVRPGYLSMGEIKDHVPRIESETESRSFLIALEKRYSTLVLPFVIALFTAPFAFSLHRKARAAGVGYAVLIWLLFTAASSVFEQIGLAGHLSPQLAVWAPLLVFASLGLYRVARIPT